MPLDPTHRVTGRPTVEELERILAMPDEGVPIEILPNGEIRASTGDRPAILTLGQSLGDDY